MRSSKCAWTLLSFESNSNRPLPIDRNPANLYLQDEDGQIRIIDRYDRDFPREYLGIHQTATGEDDAQVKKMLLAIEKWNGIITASKLPPALNLQALMSRIHKTLLYPLPTLTLDREILQKMSNKLYWVSLPKCGIVRTFPISIRHLPHKYQGLQLPDLYIEQETAKLRELISFSYKDSVEWDQLCLGLESLQHFLGLSDIVYNFPYDKFQSLCNHSWIMTQWRFISSQKDMKIQGWRKKKCHQRTHDSFLMEKFAQCPDVTSAILKKLNQCRIFLQVWTISDIVDGAGVKITNKAFRGQIDGSRVSKDKWKKIHRPIETTWATWRKYLHQIYCTEPSERTLHQPLGPWVNEPTQKWQWFYHNSTNALYKVLPGHYRCYKMSRECRSNTRLGTASFRLHSIVDPNSVDITSMSRATICMRTS